MTRNRSQVGDDLRARALLLLVGVALLQGCYGHVTLPPPPPDSATQAQFDAYNARMRPRTAKEVTVTSYVDDVGRTVRTSTKTTDILVLGDGTQVRHPEDLIPVVGVDSVVAKRARSAAASREASEVWTGVAAGALFGGGLIVIFGPSFTSSTAGGASSALYVGLALSGAAIVPGAIALITSAEASELRRDAFASYVRHAKHSLAADVDEAR